MNRYIKVSMLFVVLSALPLMQTSAQFQLPNEAPAGFDNKTNGFVNQTEFDELLDTFSEVEDAADGLGPTFNEASCATCHSIGAIGGAGLNLETRAGTIKNGEFVEHAGGSLVHDRVLSQCRQLQEHVGANEPFTKRASLSTLGDGFIEAIADDTIIAISRLQPPDMRGTVIRVPILEAKNPNVTRVGRFGWKNQHASLESFSADAYLNEMGVTSDLLPVENTAEGRSVASCDKVADPEDEDNDVRLFADFMRATKVPDRGPISPLEEIAGLATFVATGCATCHVPVLVTAPTGTAINGGAFRVPPALGSKIIKPFSDLLLHDVGTNDPIVQNGGPGTYNQVRTPPLWGLRKRQSQLMHDGQATSIEGAITRHKGQALKAYDAYNALSTQERARLLTFLRSL